MKPKICVYCGSVYTPTNNGQKYCSPECRIKAHPKKKKTYIKKCSWCGKEFKATHGHQKYCSDECRRLKHCWSSHLTYEKQPEKYKQLHRRWIENNRERYNRQRRKSYESRKYYPCSGYRGNIPTEICLNCSAKICRYERKD